MKNTVSQIVEFDPSFDAELYLNDYLNRLRIINNLKSTQYYKYWDALSKYNYYMEGHEDHVFLEIQEKNEDVLSADIEIISELFQCPDNTFTLRLVHKSDNNVGLYSYFNDCNKYMGNNRYSNVFHHSK